MTLRWYRRPRLVVMNPNTPVLDAARALENNNIGAILVQQARDIVGMVTDRDLAVRVTGRGLDPQTTRLSEVMSTEVVTLPIDAEVEEAIALMCTRGIRRIPLVDERGWLAGMVTLDDLILDETASMDDVSAVIEAQIGEGGPAPSQRSPALSRSAARAEATYRRFINEVWRATGLNSFELTETAVRVVLAGLVRRLTGDEALHFIAQLPSILQEELRALPPGPDKDIVRESIEADLVDRLDIDPMRAAELLEIIGTEVMQSVSSGEAEKVHNQLPPDMREAFTLSVPL